jgi:hypothetical protein
MSRLPRLYLGAERFPPSKATRFDHSEAPVARLN